MPRRYPKTQKEADVRYEAKFKSIQLRISFETHEKLKNKAKLTGDSVTVIIRTAIEDAVANSLEKHSANVIDTNTAHINDIIGK